MQKERDRAKFELNDVRINGERIASSAFVNVRYDSRLQRGDQVSLRGKVNSGARLSSLSVYGEILKIQKPKYSDGFLAIRDKLSDRIRAQLSGKTASLGLAYLLGERYLLSKELRTTFTKSGLSHIIVASGFALSVLVNMVARIFRSHSKFATTSFSLLTMMMFVGFTGFTPSMTRAFLMSSLSVLVGHAGRTFRPLRLIVLVGCLSLLFSPNNLWNVGWQLSFSAFFGISVLAPVLKRFFYGEQDINPLVDLFLTSLSAQLCCLPISIIQFESFSLVGLVSNLILPPLLGVTMVSVFLTGVFGGVIADWTDALLIFHIEIAEFFARQSWLQIW